MKVHNYRMNRAVGIMNKGDEFTSVSDDPKVMSLLGAGYLDDLGEVERDEVRGGPTGHATGASSPGPAPRPDHMQDDRGGSEEDGPVRPGS